VHVGGHDRDGLPAELAVLTAERALLEHHRRLTRFDPDSELCRLNADPRRAVPASTVVRSFVHAATRAAEHTGGLVDPTLLDAVEAAGYDRDRAAVPGPPPQAPGPAAPAGPSHAAAWRQVEVDDAQGFVVRPPGTRLDGGGIVKGQAADTLAARLGRHPTFAVDCAGDLRIGGTSGQPRAVLVADPFGGDPIAVLQITHGAVATSGIGRRRWRGEDGAWSHHLIDPSTGRPCNTGLVQVTALAPSAVEAEALAKAALLSGPEGAEAWLPHGGVIVRADGTHRRIGA
jgi:thiamine biosynthesis lipoprotein